MAERTISTGTYVIVWIVLVMLTILTVSVSFFPVGGHLAHCHWVADRDLQGDPGCICSSCTRCSVLG